MCSVLKMHNFTVLILIIFIGCFGLGLASVTAFSGHRKHKVASHHPIPTTYLVNTTVMEKIDEVNLRKVSFLSTSFFLSKPNGKYDDSVDYVLAGYAGEPMVADVFRQKIGVQQACRKHNGTSSMDNNYHHNSGIVLDIGANGGVYGMYAAMLGCKVYFFDVQWACARGIYLSTIMNMVHNHAHVIHHPVGNSSNNVELDVSSSCYGSYRTSTGRQHKEFEQKETKKEKTWMQMIRLDDLFEHSLLSSSNDHKLDSSPLPPIVLVKIDTEGFEPMVIHGMEKLLRAHLIDELTIEFSPEFWNVYGFTPSFVATTAVEKLWDAGYQTVKVLMNHGARGNAPEIPIKDRDHLFQLLSGGLRNQRDYHFKLSSRSLSLN